VLAVSNPQVALSEAEESIRLVAAGAGDMNYSAALNVLATISDARGQFTRAAQALRAAITHESRTGMRAYVIAYATNAVIVTVSTGSPEAHVGAATLAGALAGPAVSGVPLFVTQELTYRYEPALAQLRMLLGPDLYNSARERGSVMTYDELIEFTLNHLARIVDLDSSSSS